jgi:hypothetical protein
MKWKSVAAKPAGVSLSAEQLQTRNTERRAATQKSGRSAVIRYLVKERDVIGLPPLDNDSMLLIKSDENST